MKIDWFCLADQDVILTGAIHEVMELFGVQPAAAPAGCTVSLGKHTVFLENCLAVDSDLVTVTTTMYYHSKTDDGVDKLVVSNCDRLANNQPAAVKRIVKLNILAAMRQLTGRGAVPWGILRGIRPGKIVHRLLDQALSRTETVNTLNAHYGIEQDKAELITDIAFRQRRFLLLPEKASRLVSIYIGIPFCPSRCLYCSFPAYVLPGVQQTGRFLQGLAKEIKLVRALMQRYGFSAQTVYIGGGTPTSLNSGQFAEMLEGVRSAFVTAETMEFTVEAGRPDSIDDRKIDAMRRMGVTRVSVNPQTMQEKTLKQIGRKHTVRDIISLFQKIRQSGVPVINMDVIAGLPGENELDITDTMEQICHLAPDNLTLHTLALKRGSLLKASLAEHILPSPETTQNMHKIAAAYAGKLQMQPYYLYRQKHISGNLENIGYAKPGAECVYNIQIMEERQTIFGLGPAATTKIVNPAGWSLENRFNAKDPATYVNKIDDAHFERCQLLAQAFAH
ncbi:coproporphyrinogen dehydrogenase HemZ|uniref:Oxygen-independent coproporphyrinogen-3 oxidase n=1 Tax=Dendrosporobacter quercicolus TaxID=146817 RepID=A0A1G9KRS6_9FIRM|nr:coproporphyrinogen dehydrogenase HemZ [Dendrosporobacter quercicolus]NSL46486.1 coproporphyrinogen dehydrogenase HemZ [Dendrosporobacter quercicolus DSM 1736]SDL52428.1 oxygen-independent coproporphyrinogen-3 oxidase [Dendrosporobacter quercicolus]